MFNKGQLAGLMKKAQTMQEDLKRAQDELGNIEVCRDWGWAPDYVEALVLMARSETPDDYVIATGEAHSVREFVDAAFTAAGIKDWEGLITVDPRLHRPTDAGELRGDASKAWKQLGWRSRVPFAEVVAHMVHADLHALDTRT